MNNSTITVLDSASNLYLRKAVSSEISSLSTKTEPVSADLLLIEDSSASNAKRSITVGSIIKDTSFTTSNITTNNVSTTKHGFVPIAPNDATKYLDGTVAWNSVTDADLSLTNGSTTNDVTVSKHGFVPVSPGNSLKFLDGTGAWSFANSTSVTKTSNYTITDTDGYGIILVDPNNGYNGLITITLPSLANNIGRMILIKTLTNGYCNILTAGSDSVDFGETTLQLVSQYDYTLLLGGTTRWCELNSRTSYSTGWMRRSDWTSVYLGSTVIVMDGLSGSYTYGELVKEYSDAGRTTSTGCTGIVSLYTSTGLTLGHVTPNSTTGNGFTNNYYLKGLKSNATSQVNGDTKNVSNAVFHYLGFLTSTPLSVTLIVSTDMTEANSYFFTNPNLTTTTAYSCVYGYENDLGWGCVIYTGSAGLYIADGTLVDTEDYYYKVIVERYSSYIR